MALIIVTALGTRSITASETDSVTFLGVGTLDIAGTSAAPINVTLSSVGGIGLLDTINISNANVTVTGLAGVSALVNYNIGSGGTLNLVSTVGVAVGTSLTFTAPDSHLKLGAGIDISLLGGIFGFGPGKTIDVSALASSVSYADAAGANTGGVLTLRDSGGTVVGTLGLASGDFIASNFKLTADSTGGTLISFGTAVTTVVATPATADLGAGQTVSLTIGTTDAVTVTGGTPSLLLNDGGVAVYNAAASTPTSLSFTYVVGTGQNTPDLAITGISLNGAALTNAGSTPVDLSSAAINPAGILQIDTTTPTLAVTASPGTADLGAGQVVTFTAGVSEAVAVVGGTPTLVLNDGGIATYNAAASTPTSLVFTHTIAAGQNTSDLAVIAANANGATVADGAGNAVNLASLIGNPAGVLQVDTTAPTITGVTTNPGSGSVRAGQVIAITLTPSEAVAVAGGTPSLTLSNGATATFNPGASTPTSLVYTYTAAPGQDTPDIAVVASNLNGATISDPAGNNADLSGAIGNPPGVLSVDTVTPTLLSVTVTPSTGDLGIGQTAIIRLGTSEAVVVTGGMPTLSLNDGGVAAYNAAASTATSLAFSTTVAAGQNTPDLAVTGVVLNGATVADPAGNVLNLAPAVGNPAGILQIDGTAPFVTSTSTMPGSGTVRAGQTVTVLLGTNEAVTVAGGTPSLALTDGGTAIYNPAASTPTSLAFTYTVAAGQNGTALGIAGVNLNGAVVADAAGNSANLNGAVATLPGTLQVDTTAPTFLPLTASPGTADLGIGQVISFTAAVSEAVTVAGGTPTLALNDGGVATYNGAASTPTSLVFTYTVAAGQNTSDLAVTGVSANGGVVADTAGNAASLAGLIGNPAGVLQVDTTTPTITGVMTNPGSAGLGQVINITLTSSEPVVVSGGTPTLTLTDGGTATYNPGASTATGLVFSYPVAPGQNATNVGVTASSLNGATIADGAGNNANLAGAISNPANPPTITVQQLIDGLYLAFYDRAADQPGYLYWENQVGLTQSQALNTLLSHQNYQYSTPLGQQFFSTQSTYFASQYSALSDSAFVNKVYVNFGGNAADTNGLNFWVGLLATQSRQLVASQIAQDFLTINLNSTSTLTAAELAAAQARQQAFYNKVAVSEAFATASATNPFLVAQSASATSPSPAFTAAIDIEQGVTTAPNTVVAAQAVIAAAVTAGNVTPITTANVVVAQAGGSGQSLVGATGAGNSNILIGSAGNDSITGGTGRDVLVTNGGGDTIMLGAHVHDRIEIYGVANGATNQTPGSIQGAAANSITNAADQATGAGFWGQAPGAAAVNIFTLFPGTSAATFGTSASQSLVSGFLVGDTGDSLDFSLLSFGAAAAGHRGLTSVDGASVAATGASTMATVSSGGSLSGSAADVVVVAGTTFSNAAALAQALKTGTFGLALSANPTAGFTANMLFAYNDAAGNGHIADVAINEVAANRSFAAQSNVIAQDLVQLTGVSVGSLTNNNIQIVG